MGFNDHIDDLTDVGFAIAVEAKAISVCEYHGECSINNGDPEADQRAYKIGTVKNRAWGYDRQSLMDAIKSAIDDAGESCAGCDRHRDD